MCWLLASTVRYVKSFETFYPSKDCSIKRLNSLTFTYFWLIRPGWGSFTPARVVLLEPSSAVVPGFWHWGTHRLALVAFANFFLFVFDDFGSLFDFVFVKESIEWEEVFGFDKSVKTVVAKFLPGHVHAIYVLILPLLRCWMRLVLDSVVAHIALRLVRRYLRNHLGLHLRRVVRECGSWNHSFTQPRVRSWLEAFGSWHKHFSAGFERRLFQLFLF